MYTSASLCTLLFRFAALVVLLAACSLVATSAGDKDKSPPTEKSSSEEIRKLIEQLKDERFKLREEAMRKLKERDDALTALRQAAKSADAEVARRAQQAIETITKRLAKRALQRAKALLKQGRTDQFVELAVRWREYADDDCWKAALEHAQLIADEAGKASGHKFRVLPRTTFAKLKFIHADNLETLKGRFIRHQRIIAGSVKASDGFIHDSFIICNGPIKAKYTLGASIVFVNGDLCLGDRETLASIGDSIVICDGDVSASASLDDCLIIASGNVSIGASIKGSMVISGGDVKVGVRFPGAPIRNSQIQSPQRHLLNLAHFFDPADLGIEVTSSKEMVRVESCVAEKAFGRSGIRKEDQIVSVNGERVESAEAFRQALRRHIKEPTPLLLEIRRQEGHLRVEVRVLTDAP